MLMKKYELEKLKSNLEEVGRLSVELDRKLGCVTEKVLRVLEPDSCPKSALSKQVSAAISANQLEVQAKLKEADRWVFGFLEVSSDGNELTVNGWPVIPESIGRFTGLRARNGYYIFSGDICKLDVGNDEREFEVLFTTVHRKVVNLPGFEHGLSDVAITGVVFRWYVSDTEYYDLFPCIDKDGKPNTLSMSIVGNTFERKPRRGETRKSGR